jgi:hypothetical protein
VQADGPGAVGAGHGAGGPASSTDGGGSGETRVRKRARGGRESSSKGERESSVGPIYRERRGDDIGGEKWLAKAINGGGHYLHVDCNRYFTNKESKWGRERRRHPFLIRGRGEGGG